MRSFTLLRSLLWSAMVCIVLSCQDQKEVSPAIQTPISVAEAQEWFRQQEASLSGRVSQEIPERNIHWEQAQLISLSNGEPAITAPLQYATGGPGVGGLANALFFREGGQPKVQVVKMVSDSLSFYQNQQQISLDNFTGLLTMHDWQENFLYGFRYEQGKVAGPISQRQASGRTGTGCQLVTITHYTTVCVGDNCETRVDGVMEYLECPGGGGGGGPVPRGPIGGGGSGPRPLDPNAPKRPFTFASIRPKGISMPGFEKEQIDLKKYLGCFYPVASTSAYEITVYVDEPSAGSGSTKNGLNVGHAFVGFKKTSAGGQSLQQVFGFYPSQLTTSWNPSNFKNNGESPYSVSVTFAVNADQFQQAINGATYMISEMYNISEQNCTDAVFYICDAAQIHLPKTKSAFPYGSAEGHSPGQLGYDLRHNPTSGQLNSQGGNAPMSQGPCL